MTKNKIYGGQPEIQAFVEFYKVKVQVSSDEFKNIITHKVANETGELFLYLTGITDRGHYDVIKCVNENFHQNFRKLQKRNYYNNNKVKISEKRKRDCLKTNDSVKRV